MHGDVITTVVAVAGVLLSLSVPGSAGALNMTIAAQTDWDGLVEELRDLPASILAIAPSDGVLPPGEVRRRQVYVQLLDAGAEALPALLRGLQDPDVRLRRNVALALSALSGGWLYRGRPRLDVRTALPVLIATLRDLDSNLRASSAQAIGSIGADAAPAVPALIALLTNTEEGSRNVACTALQNIGPAARGALPALRQALSDPSVDVRRFAQQAIERIER